MNLKTSTKSFNAHDNTGGKLPIFILPAARNPQKALMFICIPLLITSPDLVLFIIQDVLQE